MGKLDDAITELQGVDVNDRQPVANALRLLQEHKDESGGGSESVSDTDNESDRGI